MFDEENLISLAIFPNYFGSSCNRFFLCFKKKDLNGRESIFQQIYELSGVSYSFLNLYLYNLMVLLSHMNRVSSEKEKSFRESFAFFTKYFFSRPFYFVFAFRFLTKISQKNIAKISRKIIRKFCGKNGNYAKKHNIFANNT